MNYDEMPAGREMDLAVAEITDMAQEPGWGVQETVCSVTFGAPQRDGWTKAEAQTIAAGIGSVVGLIPPKRPSTDIAAAWEVVEKIQTIGVECSWRYAVQITCLPHLTTVSMNTHGFGTGRFVLMASAPTAPLAICRAVLNAVG